jgi:hypothetical protein
MTTKNHHCEDSSCSSEEFSHHCKHCFELSYEPYICEYCGDYYCGGCRSLSGGLIIYPDCSKTDATRLDGTPIESVCLPCFVKAPHLWCKDCGELCCQKIEEITPRYNKYSMIF